MSIVELHLSDSRNRIYVCIGLLIHTKLIQQAMIVIVGCVYIWNSSVVYKLAIQLYTPSVSKCFSYFPNWVSQKTFLLSILVHTLSVLLYYYILIKTINKTTHTTIFYTSNGIIDIHGCKPSHPNPVLFPFSL